jgi:hypothetical protein
VLGGGVGVLGGRVDVAGGGVLDELCSGRHVHSATSSL